MNPSHQNQALTPIVHSERAFNFQSHLSLWFSLGVGLLVIQVGAFLVPAVGTKDALSAIILGSVIGSALLALTAWLGCQTGLSSAGLMHSVYGHNFARIPVILNIVQLVGWTTFELVIMRDGTTAILAQTFGIEQTSTTVMVLATLLWGSLVSLLMLGSMLTLVRTFINRFGLPLVIVSLIWLSWHFYTALAKSGLDTFLNKQGDGSLGMAAALDIVIAMPVSWLPLVADYARYGKSRISTFNGTLIGYTIANIWCYGLGFIVAGLSEPGSDLVTTLLLAQGGLLALSLILLDEVDNAYGDVYSASVCTHSLKPDFSINQWGLGIGILCTILALVLPMQALEPFLLLLSSVFVPLYGVILGRLLFAHHEGDRNSTTSRAIAVLVWLLGICLFQGVTQLAPEWGATLPTLALTALLGHLTRPRHVNQ
jgi:nucleobase:cation symporter-1, NCS1 family